MKSTDYLGKNVTVTIDRPVGSKHPQYGYEYPINYGYIAGVMGKDGEELDAYIIGITIPVYQFTGKCIAIIKRLDDQDDKLVVVPFNKMLSTEEIKQYTNFQEKWFKTEIITTYPKSEGWTVGWGFSSRCDLQCPFCYSSKIRHTLQVPELEIAEAEQFLSQNGKHIHAINFGTGECFLSPSFPHILELCHKYAPNALIAVTTNGAFADLSSDARSIVRRYISECDVSLDFAQPDAHDHWRGKGGTWQRARKAIELSLDFGLNTSIVMIGTAQTLKEKNIQGLLKISETYQVALRINLYMPTFGDYSFIPSMESVFTTLIMLKTWCSDIRSSDRLIGNLIDNHASEPYKETKLSCRILPNGSISPSTYLIEAPWLIPNTLGNINLSNLLFTEPFLRYTSPSVPIDCERCSILSECQVGSVERRWLWIHSLEAPDPLCPRLYSPEYKMFPLSTNEKKKEDWPGPIIHLDYLPTIVALPPLS